MTAFDLAQRYVGIREIAGSQSHPLVSWWLSLCGFGLDAHDEVPWCSAFANGVAWELRLPRSKSAAARSWLTIGVPVALDDAMVGYDVVVLKRGSGDQPGPEVIAAPGHVAFFAGHEGDQVLGLGGNQLDGVCVARFPVASILGIRRLSLASQRTETVTAAIERMGR